MLPLLLHLASAQVATEPTGEVTHATVFPDRAQVTRTVRVSLEPGENEVVFRDLPPNLDPQTLQASGQGAATIRGLSVERVELASDRRDRVDELNTRILTEQDAKQALQDDITAAEAELAFLRGLGTASAAQLSAELMFAPDTTSDADALAGLLRTRIDAALESIRQARAAMRDVDAGIDALRRELRQVQGAQQWARHEVTVLVGADVAGASQVELTYTVPGARWVPSWDARATPSDDTLSMTLSATVVQTTGEDWTQAALTLSTARPAEGVMAPELSPFWLTQGYVSSGSRQRRMDNAPVMMDGALGGMEDDYEEDEMVVPSAPMLVQQAQVSERAVATTFDVSGTTRVDGDGTSRRVLVTEVEVPVTWMHVAVPMLDERAWMVAEGTWPQTWSLLAGQVSIFSDDSYVGAMSLPVVGTGGTFELGFGPDAAVRVDNVVVEDLTRGPGLFRKPGVTRIWRTDIDNGHTEAVHISLRDRVPVPTQDVWKVEPLGQEPDIIEDEGLVRWEFDLPPSVEVPVEHGWEVRWPKKQPPGGL